jgi:hypothetical protein
LFKQALFFGIPLLPVKAGDRVIHQVVSVLLTTMG